MKLLCDTCLFNRRMPNARTRAQKATLALGFHPPGKSNATLFIIHFTPQNKTGLRYKVKENLEKIFTKFVNDGKATISFKEPEHDIQIKCDPIQLKCFLKTLKLGLDGKTEMNKLGLSSLAATPVPKKSHPVTKFVVAARGDYPVKGFPKTLETLSINGIDRRAVDAQILFLRNLTNLDLSDNAISAIPKDLGKLKLVTINFSKNKLGKSQNTKDWMWLLGNGVQKSLRELNLSENELMNFPHNIVKLQNLKTLKINNNSIKRIPFSIRRLNNLRFFHISSNQLESLPQSMHWLHLEILDVWGNNFLPISDQVFNRAEVRLEQKKIPHLWELAARVVIHKKLPYSPATIPSLLVDIISEIPLCFCGLLCFSSKVHERCTVLYMENLKELIFSRDRVMYADCVFCSEKCAKKYMC